MARGKRQKNNALGAGVGASAAIAAALSSLALVLSLPGEDASASGPQWAREVARALGGKGYDWIVIDVADRVALVGGLAPDVDSRRYGFEAAAQALRDSEGAGQDVTLVVDATRMDQGEQGAGVALAALGAAPDKEACQKAFDDTLAQRPIVFEPDSERLPDADNPLLDALAGLALRCHAFSIEVQGHTEISGSPARNRALSERRAAKVSDELVNRGVDSMHLSAVGYGPKRPLVRASNASANARNNRITIEINELD